MPEPLRCILERWTRLPCRKEFRIRCWFRQFRKYGSAEGCHRIFWPVPNSRKHARHVPRSRTSWPFPCSPCSWDSIGSVPASPVNSSPEKNWRHGWRYNSCPIHRLWGWADSSCRYRCRIRCCCSMYIRHCRLPHPVQHRRWRRNLEAVGNKCRLPGLRYSWSRCTFRPVSYRWIRRNPDSRIPTGKSLCKLLWYI